MCADANFATLHIGLPGVCSLQYSLFNIFCCELGLSANLFERIVIGWNRILRFLFFVGAVLVWNRVFLLSG